MTVIKDFRNEKSRTSVIESESHGKFVISSNEIGRGKYSISVERFDDMDNVYGEDYVNYEDVVIAHDSLIEAFDDLIEDILKDIDCDNGVTNK